MNERPRKKHFFRSAPPRPGLRQVTDQSWNPGDWVTHSFREWFQLWEVVDLDGSGGSLTGVGFGIHGETVTAPLAVCRHQFDRTLDG